MTREQVVQRALSACGHKAKYGIGKGGANPMRAVPWNEEMECDCSGFMDWALGIHRMLWVDSWRWHWFATGNTLFKEIGWLAAVPGDTIGWPDRVGTDKKRREGHVGIITEVGPSGPTKVAHCSMGNVAAFGDAIMETTADIFARNGAIVARCTELGDATRA